MALEHGLSVNGAGGAHHAGPEGGSGFCVFNDVAIAVANLLAQGGPCPVLIVDCDVHQGDGTARCFAGDPRVFTLSVHADRNFPTVKATSSLDVALADRTGDLAYLDALRTSLAQALAACKPRLVYYNAGVDVWEGDRLGRLSLSTAAIRARDAHVIGTIRALDLPLVCVIGGGYDPDPERLANHHAILFEEAAARA
jgi:acetoin utilization deacetylase AcuC-like enzyme